MEKEKTGKMTKYDLVACWLTPQVKKKYEIVAFTTAIFKWLKMVSCLVAERALSFGHVHFCIPRPAGQST